MNNDILNEDLKQHRVNALNNAKKALEEAFPDSPESVTNFDIASEKIDDTNDSGVSEEEINDIIDELNEEEPPKSIPFKFHWSINLKSFISSIKYKVCNKSSDEFAHRFMKLAGIMKPDTKYVFISKHGGVEQINVEVPTTKIIYGRLFGDKYIKV